MSQRIPVHRVAKPSRPVIVRRAAATPQGHARPAVKARTRRELRAIAALEPREAEIVAFLVEEAGGNASRWPAGIHAALADRLGVSRSASRMYLAALRRTLGLPVAFRDDGPRLRTGRWCEEARRTGDYGPLAPLRSAGG